MWFASIIAVLAFPAIWADSGITMASVVVGCIFLIIPAAALVAKSDARRVAKKKPTHTWSNALSFIVKKEGLVYLNWDYYWTENSNQMCFPSKVDDIYYDQERHALIIKAWGMLYSTRLRTPYIYTDVLSLPEEIDSVQAQAIAEVFQLLWKLPHSKMSESTKNWLNEQIRVKKIHPN
jgi:hypothetical protein